MSRARALVVPNVEEFGIPLSRRRQLGARCSVLIGAARARPVIDEVTGVLHPAGVVGAMPEAMRNVDFERFDQRTIRKHALRFRPEAFRDRLTAEVERVTGRRVSGLISDTPALH
jgi:hypothetical protein